MNRDILDINEGEPPKKTGILGPLSDVFVGNSNSVEVPAVN